MREQEAWRQAHDWDVPTLGRLFTDTPGVPSPDDDGRVPGAVSLEEWAAQDWPLPPLDDPADGGPVG